jgi:hypothetical protein
MPAYVESRYGFGEAICKGRGFVRWGQEADCDSVVFVTALFVPMYALKTIHTYDWNGSHCQAIPIRGSWALVVSAYLRRILYGPLTVGLLLTLVIGISLFDRGEGLEKMRVTLVLVIVPLLGVSGFGFWFLSHADQRCCKIRWVLGRHNFGSSDPAVWTEELLKTMANTRELFGKDSYAEAVFPALERKDFSRAMWAARLTVALENGDQGEELTDTILQDADVLAAIERIRRDPSSWAQVMNGSG